MKCCPKCNRTYSTEAQRFCTIDGEVLVPVEVKQPAGSNDTTALNAPTMVMPHETVAKTAEPFDPYKTIAGTQTLGVKNEPTGEMKTRATHDLASSQFASTQESSLRQTSGPASTPNPANISETLRELSAPPSLPEPQQASGSLRGRDTGEIETAVLVKPRSSAPLEPPSAPLKAPSAPLPEPAPVPSSPSAPLPFAESSQPQPVQQWAPARKSKATLIMGVLAVLLLLGIGVAGAGYVFVLKPYLAKRASRARTTTPNRNSGGPSTNTRGVSSNSNTKQANIDEEPPPVSPPADSAKFTNSSRNLDGRLADHFVDFSFYYPRTWQKDPNSGVPGASNFVEVHRRLPPDFTQESLAVGWYSLVGSSQSDQDALHTLVESTSSQISQKGIDGYHKVSEGQTTLGVYEGYEFRFEGRSQDTEKVPFKIWGRVIFLPARDGGKSGVTLYMLATSLASELHSADDVGEKGGLPMVLKSFRFGGSTSGSN
jgi:hypothetical protein